MSVDKSKNKDLKVKKQVQDIELEESKLKHFIIPESDPKNEVRPSERAEQNDRKIDISKTDDTKKE